MSARILEALKYVNVVMSERGVTAQGCVAFPLKVFSHRRRGGC